MSEPLSIPCLTVHQPWATLIAYGIKKVETRRWGPRDGTGWVGIHSAAALPGPNDLAALRYYSTVISAQPDTYPRGQVIALAYLSELVVMTEAWIAAISPAERLLGDYHPGWCGWVFSRVVPLPQPIPARGQQGLWRWTPPDAVAALLPDWR
jgi:hypothetical protein